jgi:hypothetical protein
MYNRLLKAQEEINKIDIKRSKEAYKYWYAPLESFLPEVINVLNKYELALIQKVTSVQDNPRLIRVNTLVIDCKEGSETFGTSVVGDVETYLPIQNVSEKANLTQECGAAITYAKRYAISALFGITVDEDTDAATNSIAEAVGESLGKVQETHRPIPHQTAETKTFLSDKQRSYLFVLAKKLGLTIQEAEDIIKKPISELTTKEAANAINLLTNKYCNWESIRAMMDDGSFHSLLVNWIKDKGLDIDTSLSTDLLIKAIMKSYHALNCYEFMAKVTEK